LAATGSHWPCDSCGAGLRFAPGQTQLVCNHCGHVQSIAAEGPWAQSRALAELDLQQGLRNDLPGTIMDEVRATTCPSCGALVEFDGAAHATECPFCATPAVAETGSHRLIKPQALIPFVLSEAEARSAMTAWLGRLWFAPSGLVDYARRGRAMTGMYVPYWTFDAETRSRYRGQRGDHYYRTQTVTVQVNGRAEPRQQQVRHTRWSPASGQVARRFDDVLVMASSSLPQRLGDELTPWDLNTLVAYKPDFLAGFRAEGYTVPLADGYIVARARMAGVIQMDVRQDIGGDEQRIDAVETAHSKETFKHILLPIWIAAYKFNGKSYRFLVNGQTGEVQGERPWSVWKILLACLVVAAIIGTVVWLDQTGQITIDVDGY
jgi:predicted RNA-binding Zn-ribbon protein involved in translation (DUF1610 family)